MALDTEDGESFTEEWRLRHETLINEIRSLQSHVTTATETVKPSQVQAEQEPQKEPQIEPQIETNEPVAEEMDGDSNGDGEESMGDSGPSWKRQAKELDRLNARLQASLETSIPSIAMATKGRSKSSCPKKSSCQGKAGRSKSEAPPRGLGHGLSRSCSPRSQASPDGRAKMSNPNELSKGSKDHKDLKIFKDKTDQKDKDKMEKKGSEKMEKGSSTRHEAEPEVSRSSALATTKWPEPTRPPKRAVVKKRTAPRTVSRRLQVGAPFDQPRMSVMARLSVAQAEAKEVEATKAAPTVTVKNWNIPRLCLEGAKSAQSFSGVVPSTTGSYVPSSTSSPQMWYRPVSQVSPVSQRQVPSGAFSGAQVLQKASPVSQRLAL